MGLLQKIRAEFVDIVEWTEPSLSEILAYRFPRQDNEIKYGAKLTVREGQAAVFVNEGQLADVFSPGMYTLETRNLPVLSTLKGWKYGFSSPFKAEVYFIATRQWTDQKWGTQNPVIVRDPEFGPVRIRAYGTYAFRITDPAAFLRQLVATEPDFEVFDISHQMRNSIVSRIADVIAQSKISILDMAGNYDRLGQLAMGRVGPDLEKMGLSLTQFFIENVSVPPEVEQALDKRAQMGMVGDLGRYTQYQAAEAMRDAAQNPGGIAGLGAALGAGAGIAQQMTGAISASAVSTQAAPPPLPANTPAFFVAFNNAQTGPFDFGAVTGKIRDGSLTRSTLVWKAGMSNWAAADSVDELRPLFTNVPPPLSRT